MFIRLAHLKISPNHLDRFKKIYREEIMPVLKNQRGNLSVKLLEPLDKLEDFISITEWRSKVDIEIYESSGTYRKLVDKIRLMLTKDPVLKTYHVEAISQVAPSVV